MGTRTQHTKTDLSRVLRGRCWLRNTRYSQLALGAAARLLCSRVCESGSVATARPCQRTGPSSSLRPNIFLLSCARFRELFFAVVVPKQRSVLGTVAPRVCCLQLVPQRRRPAALRARCRAAFPAFAESRKAADIGRRSIFFLLILREFDFRLVFLATHLSAAPGSSSSSSSSSCSLKTPTVGAPRRCGRDPTTDTAQMLGFFCLASLTSSSMQLTSHRHRHRPHPEEPDSHSLPLQPAHRTHTCASNT